MSHIDKKTLYLIDLLLFEKKISSIKDFCAIIKMQASTISKIKNGTAHFTPLQLESICKKFNVNANWIFDIEKEVFIILKSA